MGRKSATDKSASVRIMKITGVNDDGDLLGQCFLASGKLDAFRYQIIENRRIKPPLQEGDEVLARLAGRTAKVVARTVMANVQKEKIYGIVARRGGDYYLLPSEKNSRTTYVLTHHVKIREGDFVSAVPDGERHSRRAAVVQNFGPFDLNKATEVLILDKYAIPHGWNVSLAAEAERLPVFDGTVRDDLTAVPLVTIDGDDSKDFDDAVWAEKTPAGFRLIVAIADVAFYVRDGSGLDREAYRRGNSVYLPNMVVPMLPEKLSNRLCSLQPQKLRAAIAAIIDIDCNGKLLGYDFRRAVIRSAARLTYKEVQAALDGERSENIQPVFKSTVLPVYEAYLALDKARRRRGALELDVPEVKIKTGKNGEILAVERRETLTAHKIIEEFMIAANVAAALALKKSKLPVMYRVHDRPPADKLENLKPLLEDLRLKLPDAPALKPQHFNRLSDRCVRAGINVDVTDLILRMQAQAQYSPHNIGHFGLGLKDYVHFTSPIRRYADLLIHRALITALELPDGGGLVRGHVSVGQWEDIGLHLCETERRATEAERDITARMMSAYLLPAVGQVMNGVVSGVSTAGVFVRLEPSGAEGLIPLSSLPDDFYQLGCGGLILSGERRGTVFRPGEAIEVKLEEASPISGSLILKYLSPEDGEDYYQKGHGRRPEGLVAPKRCCGRKSRGRKSATVAKKSKRKGQR